MRHTQLPVHARHTIRPRPLALSLPLVVALACARPAVLPREIRSALDRDFPGWRFGDTGVPEEHSDWFAADFDDDGARDYAVHIQTAGPEAQQVVLAFVGQDDRRGYDRTVLVRMRSADSLRIAPALRGDHLPGATTDTTHLARSGLVVWAARDGGTPRLFRLDGRRWYVVR